MGKVLIVRAIGAAVMTSICASGPLAVQAAAAARPASAPVAAGDIPGFSNSANGGIRHVATGFVCPATLAGVTRTAVLFGSRDNEGGGGCAYGLRDDPMTFVLDLSRLGNMSKPAALDLAFNKMGLPANLPAATPPLPTGQAGGPELGRFVLNGKQAAGVWVGAKGDWLLSMTVTYQPAKVEQVGSAGTSIFRALQASR